MKKLYYIGGILIVLLGSISVLSYEMQFSKNYLKQEVDDHNEHYQKYEDASRSFVEANSLIDQEEVDTASLVLYMQYILENGSQKEFDEILLFIKNYLMEENGLIMGKVRDKGEVGAANNSYESIELIILLLKGYEAWDNTFYRDTALNVERSLYEHNVKGEYLYSLYNTVTQKTDHQIDISQLKLSGMAICSAYRSEWKQIYQQSKQLVQKAYITDEFPFYQSAYDVMQDTYLQQKKIKMQDTLQIILNLAEVELVKDESINWLKQALKEGVIYEEYDSTTGKASMHTETPNIYALVARIGKTLGDNELYTLGIEKLLSFQIKDPEEKNFGAIIRPGEKTVNLYDNIQALLAF